MLNHFMYILSEKSFQDLKLNKVFLPEDFSKWKQAVVERIPSSTGLKQARAEIGASQPNVEKIPGALNLILNF